ncbi:MAG: winged helix-turn-helix transcriptional regulator [Clostridia bacterium]|nr:winged helix-turn-helix transcriptional regulator [Clostridia bacterium]
MINKTKLTESHLESLCYDFKALSDINRLKITLFLSGGEQSVNAISQNLNIGQSATSHHLRILKDARIVKLRRDANVNYYYIADEHIRSIIEMSIEHLDCEN